MYQNDPTVKSMASTETVIPGSAPSVTLVTLAAPAQPETPKRRRRPQEPGPGRGGRRVEQRSGRTIDGVRRTLRAALGAARRRGLITVNPAEGRLDAMPRIGRADTSWWQPEQVAAFLASVQADRLAALYEVAAFAGPRRGELLGLRWADVDPDGRGLTVRWSLSGVAGEHPCSVCNASHTGRRFKAPKTDAGARWVPLVDSTREALLAHRAAQERQQWGEAYEDHSLVFAAEDGTPLRPATISKTFHARADEAGLPRIRLHDMRHGAASLMLAAGVPAEQVALVLGHASPSLTRAVYAHALREPARRGAEAAAALVRPAERAHSVHSQGGSDGNSTEVSG
jgi:integrase